MVTAFLFVLSSIEDTSSRYCPLTSSLHLLYIRIILRIDF